MCGQAGVIGSSKNPTISYNILTELFKNIEDRGKDASGFWATEPESNGNIVFHKSPSRSSHFVKDSFWAKEVSKMNLNLMIMHARHASFGSDPKKNKNNHPFTSHNKNLALVHNGKLPEHHDIRKHYETNSDTDSEVLLRIFEWAANTTTQEQINEEINFNIDDFTAARIIGFKKIFGCIKEGFIAAAFAERIAESSDRYLWLFRNKHRPLYVIDVRDKLGQIFFCSTVEIWKKSLQAIPEAREFIGQRWCIELPENEVWGFNTSDKDIHLSKNPIKKFKFTRTSTYNDFKPTGNLFPIIKNPETNNPIITYLNDEEEINCSDKPKFSYKRQYPVVVSHSYRSIQEDDNDYHDCDYDNEFEDDADQSLIFEKLFANNDKKENMVDEEYECNEEPNCDEEYESDNDRDLPEGIRLSSLNKSCEDIQQMARNISIVVENSLYEGSMTSDKFNTIISSLEDTFYDLKATLAIISN